MKGKDTLQLKLTQHAERLEDIFSSVQEIRDGESSIGDALTGLKTIVIDKVPKVMKDLAYLTGFVFATFLDYRL